MEYKFHLLVFSNPVPGREDEYHDWYDNVHLREVTSTPGYASARRYELLDGPMNTTPTHRFLAVYELDDDPETVYATVAAKMANGMLSTSPAVDSATTVTGVWVPRGPVQRADKP